MECKCSTHSNETNLISELIDTLWNVNVIVVVADFCAISELIDTLWNVNDNYFIITQGNTGN